MAGNEVPNKNAAGGQSRLRPFWMETPTGGDGAHAANAGEKFSSSWLNLPESGNVDFSRFNPDKPAMSLEEQFPAGMSFHAKNPPAELDSTQARTGTVQPLYNNPDNVGKRPAYLDAQGVPKDYTHQAPTPQQSVAQAPVAQMSKSTIRPLGKPPTSSAPDGSRAASASEGMLSGIMKYLTSPAPPPRWKQYVEPMPVATSRPYKNMDTDTMKGKAAPTQAPLPTSQAPEPSDDAFAAFVDKAKSDKEARRAAVQSLNPRPLPPPYMWDGSWKNSTPNVAAAKNPANALDPALVSQLAAESQAPDGPVVSAQTPDSYATGPADAVDPALADSGFTLEPRDIGYDKTMGPERAPLSEQAPVGEHPQDEELMTGVLAGKTPVTETPEEEDRLKYLQSQRGINADRELAGQDDIRAQIARLEGYSQMDYRPLAALVDTWTGSRMAPSFAGPIDREPLIAQLQAAIQRGDQHMTDASMQELKDYADNQTRLAAANGKGTGADPMALLRERARLAGLQRESDHAWQDKRDIKKGMDAQTRAETYAEFRKVKEDEKIALDADNRDTTLSASLSDSFDSKGVGTIGRLNAALVRYRTLLDGAGTALFGGTFLASAKQKEVDSAYADYTALAKDEKILGQLTASDRQIIQDTISSNTGLVALNDMATGEGVSSAKKQIDGALARLDVSARDKVKRLRSVAGENKNPRTHYFIDTLESELDRSVGMPSDVALAISTFREQTRALAAQRAAKKKAESKGGTP